MYWYLYMEQSWIRAVTSALDSHPAPPPPPNVPTLIRVARCVALGKATTAVIFNYQFFSQNRIA